MDESDKTGMKLKGSDAAIPKPKARDIGRIDVTGFDRGVPREDVESALREHFAACGKITDVYVYAGGSRALVYFVGEGAVDKALKLNGSDVGGLGKSVLRLIRLTTTIVRGYDTSLSDTEIEMAVRELLSSCGEVREVCVAKRGYTALSIKGFEAPEKALELNGSYIGRSKGILAPDLIHLIAKNKKMTAK
ncbi:unnamed protein product [Thlaspi arvense]|uniref:RRM domain-containing protein n=1 Tax=Thlaspi arvense TaxID=13288 RepID=A0AAU9R566_THLAR|nr:unnamed protein product [Thlaspi arvense]